MMVSTIDEKKAAIRPRSIVGGVALLAVLLAVVAPQWSLAQEKAKAAQEKAKNAKSDDKEGEDEAKAKSKAWQYDPYRIRVWVALDFDGALTPSLFRAIQHRVEDGAESVAFSTWSLAVEPVPDQLLRADMVQRLASLTPNQIHALAGMSTVRALAPGKPPPRRGSATDEEEEEKKWSVSPFAEQLRAAINENDKIVLLAVKRTGLGYEIECRELDTVTRNLGLLHQRETRQRSMIPDLAFGAVYAAFRPLVRIRSVAGNGKDAEGLVRAGGLMEGQWSPSRVVVNDALVPVVRTNDRLGQPKEVNGIRETDWSYLHVTAQEDEDVTLRLHSALRGPLGGRGGSRVQRFGLKVNPRTTTTKVRLISKERGRPLSGYEIFSRHLEDKEDAIFIGLTNWNGEIEVDQKGEIPLRLLYIKNGGSLLAGIPLLAGHHEFQQAEMRDDEVRLQAEAFVRSIQNTILDTVAQRQMIASRIQKAMKEGQRDEAQQHLDKYTSLPELPVVLAQLSSRKKGMTTNDRRMQMQIDLMFKETQDLAVEYLESDEEMALKKLVNGGIGRPPSTPAPAPKGAPKKTEPKAPAKNSAPSGADEPIALREGAA